MSFFSPPSQAIAASLLTPRSPPQGRKHVRSPKEALSDAAAYFYRNRDRMRYELYLENGWPIASGSVEGACKNLVKDRMERSGMRWTEAMAEAMLRLRAVHLSGDFEEYWDFHVRHDLLRIYPDNLWTVVAE